MEGKLNGILITCDAESQSVTEEELRRLGLTQSSGTWLDTGDSVQGSILLAESEADFNQFSNGLEWFGSIFVRHIAPVDYMLELTGAESDLAAICSLCPTIAKRLETGKSFSVQARILGEGKLPYRKVVLNETLSLALEESSGAVMNCRQPEQVVSILCTPTRAYVGLSTSRQNRSAWPGGKHRFKRDDDQISRAEFKLLEALNVFDLELPSKGAALDIGASPGGWTRMLAERGLRIDAVDPGYLDPRLKPNRLVTHYRKRIQDYSPGKKQFEAIVNDMKMDARESIEIMLGFADRLTQNGVALMTLKMPKMDSSLANGRVLLDMLRIDLDRLATGFHVLGARQLYHNRSEVTVAMRSKRHSAPLPIGKRQFNHRIEPNK